MFSFKTIFLGGKWQGGGGGGGMNWEIEVDMYTLECIKWITNENLLYKKINKIKFKKPKNRISVKIYVHCGFRKIDITFVMFSIWHIVFNIQ